MEKTLAVNDFATLRDTEYARLDSQNHVYLDYTGGHLYGNTQLDSHHALLRNGVFGNPHSANPSSLKSTKYVEEARAEVLSFFNATDDYYCVFTQNASGALQIVGECYPFSDKGSFLLLADNHNSVNGIREYCKRAGGKFDYSHIHYEDLRIDPYELEQRLSIDDGSVNKLFAFPAQSNVSGVQHNLEWIKKAQDFGWDVLLDAAAFVPSNKLDLKAVSPDFVCVSFYKIFGYPTGIGALLIKKSKFEKLQKPWFAGGTVTMVGVATPGHFLANAHERFENGTVNYLDIPAVKIGLDYINQFGIDAIHEHVMSLTDYLLKRLSNLRHTNGRQIVRVFGPQNCDHRGGTIILNFFDEHGVLFPFDKIERDANDKNISIRTGCFCNPGIDEINNCVSNEELAKYFTSRDNGNFTDMVKFIGKMRGSIRVSLGFPSNRQDIDNFIDFAMVYKDTSYSQNEPMMAHC